MWLKKKKDKRMIQTSHCFPFPLSSAELLWIKFFVTTIYTHT